jgi:hypothetical protein
MFMNPDTDSNITILPKKMIIFRLEDPLDCSFKTGFNKKIRPF